MLESLTSRASRLWSTDVRWQVVAFAAAVYFAFAVMPGMQAPALVLLGALVLVAIAAGSPFVLVGVFIFVLFTRPVDFFPQLEVLQPAKMPALAALLVLCFIRLVNRETRWARSPMNVWMALLTIAWVISAVDSSDRGDSIKFFVAVMVKISILWFLLLNVVDTKRRAYALQIIAASFVALIGAYALVNKFRGVMMVEGTRAAFVGYLGDPNDLCLALLIGFPFVVETALSTRGWRRVAFGALGILLLSAVLATQSRGGLLGLGAGMYVLLWQRTKSHVFSGGLAAVGLVGLVAVAGIAGRATTATADSAVIDTSAAGRLDAWRAGMRMVRYNPVTGVGINQVAFSYGNYAVNPVSWRMKTSHNMYVQCIAETGLLGIVPFMMLVFSSLHITWRLRRKIPPDATPLEAAFRRSQFANVVTLLVTASFLSVAWYWFPYIVFAQAAASERIFLGLGNREGVLDGLWNPDE
ncbi:MAG: putative inorganic carbon (HCO3(-)) transporter [Bradymonadia bacterium]